VVQCVAKVLQSVAECCSVIQLVASTHPASCCSVLQYVRAVCCNALQYNEIVRCSVFNVLASTHPAVCCSVLQCVAVCCSVLQCAECCSVLQFVAVCCSVLHAVCCIVMQTSPVQRKRLHLKQRASNADAAGTKMWLMCSHAMSLELSHEPSHGLSHAAGKEMSLTCVGSRPICLRWQWQCHVGGVDPVGNWIA